MFVKLDEYKTIESPQHIILIDPDAPRAIHWQRGEGREWQHQVHEGQGALIEIPEPRLSLGLAELYEDVEFTPRP
jgi:Uma2 family endonuclease